MQPQGAKVSQKHVLIDKANQRVVTFASAGAFVVIFCLVASVSLVKQATYQSHILSAKRTAQTQLASDQTAAKSLKSAYQAFVNTPENVIGGSSTGTGANDGDNGQIVLDALPSKYDFPALATSLEKILTDENVQIQSISGSDDEAAQSAAAASGSPVPVPMPFQITASGSYQSVQNLIGAFQSSIRPIQIQTMSLAGDDSNLVVSISAQTFYQPEKDFSMGTKVVQ